MTDSAAFVPSHCRVLIHAFVLYPSTSVEENNVFYIYIYISQGCFVVVVFVVAVVVVSHTEIRDDVCRGVDCNSHRQYSFVCLFVCLFIVYPHNSCIISVCFRVVLCFLFVLFICLF